MLTRFATLPWRTIGVTALAVVVAYFVGARIAWDERGVIEETERAAEIAQAGEKAAIAQANINAEAIELADTTRRLERAIAAASARGQQEIDYAAEADDADALYDAWLRARDGVWRAQGFRADPADADPGARGLAPAVRRTDATAA